MSELEKAFEAGTHWKEKYFKEDVDLDKVPDFNKFAIENSIGICKWRHVDNGVFGFHDYCWETECNQSYDAEKVIKSNYCPNCGGKITD